MGRQGFNCLNFFLTVIFKFDEIKPQIETQLRVIFPRNLRFDKGILRYKGVLLRK